MTVNPVKVTLTPSQALGSGVSVATSTTYSIKTYSEVQVEKLLAGIHMLGGTVCSNCGTVHLRGSKCPVCMLKKYL